MFMKNHEISESLDTTDVTFRALLHTLGLFKRVMEPHFATFGISGAQWGVLMILYRSMTEGLPSLRLRDIGERLLIRPPSVTGVINRLQRSGLVAIQTSPADFRAKEVKLTAAGLGLIERTKYAHRAKIKAIFGVLSPDEQAQLHQMLGRIGSHLEKMEQ